MRATFENARQGFAELGYVEGQNIRFEQRGTEAGIDQLPAVAAELAGLQVDVIIAFATPAGRAAQHATSTIPIVVGSMGDPVQDGLVESLSRPGRNITGTTFLGPGTCPEASCAVEGFAAHDVGDRRIRGILALSASRRRPV